jgi:putative tryptophan/tyrosine transport system substrate-binding protein
MHRRRFIALLGGAIALPCVAAEQQKPMPVIGWLGIASGALFKAAFLGFREGLVGQGYIEGENVAIVYRFAEGDTARLPALAAELVAMPVDVIAASGGQLPAQAAQAASRTIPIVSTSAGPIVPNFARPDANITGVSNQTEELSPKRLELLHDAVPGARLIGFLSNPANIRGAGMMESAETAAAALGVRLITAEARSESELESAFAQMTGAGAGACLVMADPRFFAWHRAIVDLAARYRLPTIYEWREIVVNGGLMGYGDSFSALNRRVGDYVGRILKGAKPADLPVEQPGTIRLVINLETAKALGLTIPHTVLLRADEVIE